MKQEAKTREQRFKERQERRRCDLLVIEAFANAVDRLEESVFSPSSYFFKKEQSDET